MLGIKVQEGQYVMIGQALVLMKKTTRGHIQLSIDADKDVRILRFGKDGSLLNGDCSVKRVLARREAGVDVVLSCGHTVQLPSICDLRDRVVCVMCRQTAIDAQARIQRLTREAESFER